MRAIEELTRMPPSKGGTATVGIQGNIHYFTAAIESASRIQTVESGTTSPASRETCPARAAIRVGHITHVASPETATILESAVTAESAMSEKLVGPRKTLDAASPTEPEESVR